MKCFKTLALILLVTQCFGQAHSPTVKNENRQLKDAWAGGLNSCQFGSLDVDLDGRNDLVVFDRHGDRMLVYIKTGAGADDFLLNNAYVSNFPDIYEWVIFRDYNLDGKEDIFTYSPDGLPGMVVYLNTSENQLSFKRVVYPFLKSFQGGGYVNLLVTSVDYPGIIDLDNDGDLDILSFFGLGAFINAHINQSMEKYGHADSLDYILQQYCWGEFAESEESNLIILDTCLPTGTSIQKQERHTGSTFFLMDTRSTGNYDLILGDIDYATVIHLLNGQSSLEAKMFDYTINFPNASDPVALFSMPALCSFDLNEDGRDDLLAAPFDPRLSVSENKESIWFYLAGGEEPGDFELVSKNFLQKDMIDLGSGAYPCLVDWNRDGLLDLMVGNFNNYLYSFYDQFGMLHSVFDAGISLFLNTGTASVPEFELTIHDLGGLSGLKLEGVVPAVADLDQDGMWDLLAGHADGTLIHFEQTVDGSLALVEEKFQDIDAGAYAAPQLYDLDKDGLTDLLIGNQDGVIRWYKNTGTQQQAIFQLEVDTLGGIDVTDMTISFYGYNIPHFFNYEDETYVLVGSEQGDLFLFEQLDGNLYGDFASSNKLGSILDTVVGSFDQGIHSAACLADIDADGGLEMITGNFSGGLKYYGGRPPAVLPFLTENQKLLFTIYPNPGNGFIRLEIEEPYIKVAVVSIFDMTGNKLWEGPFSASLDVRFLPQGMYLIKVSSSQKTAIKKWVKSL